MSSSEGAKGSYGLNRLTGTGPQYAFRILGSGTYKLRSRVPTLTKPNGGFGRGIVIRMYILDRQLLADRGHTGSENAHPKADLENAIGRRLPEAQAATTPLGSHTV
jgi:hypothetical protein